jgi:CDP-glucose 4,6-dehydratase
VEAVGVDAGFWHGRRVLVTGHNGFKGSWLALWLSSLGASVTGFSARLGGGPSLCSLARVDEDVEHHEGDVRDADAVDAVVRACDPEVVLHLAAQPIVRRSYTDPASTFETNVIGTARLLDALREAPSLRSVVVVTSDKCYENRGLDRGYREDEPLGGADPYSASKAAQELVAHAYRRSFGLPLATARAGNVIGGGDFAEDRLVPDAMRAAAAGEPVRVRNPSAVRPWQHVLCPLEGYLMLAEQVPNAAEAFNFGPADDDALPVGRIVERLAALWPGGIAVNVARDPDAPAEARTLHLDSTRAKTGLGWTPRWDLDRALGEVVDWHRAFVDGADMRAKTLEQIQRFSATAA